MKKVVFLITAMLSPSLTFAQDSYELSSKSVSVASARVNNDIDIRNSVRSEGGEGGSASILIEGNEGSLVPDFCEIGVDTCLRLAEAEALRKMGLVGEARRHLLETLPEINKTLMDQPKRIRFD